MDVRRMSKAELIKEVQRLQAALDARPEAAPAPQAAPSAAESPDSELIQLSELTCDYWCVLDRANAKLQTQIWMHEAFAAMTGYSRAFLEQKGIEHMIHPDDAPKMVSRLRRISSGVLDRAEYRFQVVTRSGEVRLIRERLSVQAHEGKLRVVVVGHDITDDEDARSGALQTQALWGAAAQRLGLTAWIQDTTGAFVHIQAPPSAAQGAELERDLRRFLAAPEVHARVIAARNRSPSAWEAVWWGRRMKVTLGPMCDHQGEVLGTLGIARDVSTAWRWRMRAEVLDAREQALMRCLRDPVALVGRDRRIAVVNPAFGARRGGLVGQPAEVLVPAREVETLYNCLGYALTQGRASSYESTSDDNAATLVQVAPIERDGEVDGVVVLFRVVGAERVLQARLARLERHAGVLARLASEDGALSPARAVELLEGVYGEARVVALRYDAQAGAMVEQAASQASPWATPKGDDHHLARAFAAPQAQRISLGADQPLTEADRVVLRHLQGARPHPLTACVVAPVARADQRWGMLGVYASEPLRLDDRDTRLVQSVAARLGQGLALGT